MRAAAASAWIVACATGCSGASNAGPPLTVEEYIAAVGDAECNYRVQCGEIASLEACRASGVIPETSLPTIASLRAVFATGRAMFDGHEARACVDALNARTCDHEASHSRWPPLDCLQVARGTVHMGGSCAINAECISQSCQPPDPSCGQACCPGFCVGDVPPVAGNGASCVIQSCGDGLHCGADSKCHPLVAGGAHCAFSDLCDYGYQCRIDSTAGGTCVPAPRIGDPCAPMGLINGACGDEGAQCDPTTLTCVRVGKPGDPCDPHAAGFPCGSYQTCDTTGHCATYAPIGAACTTSCASLNQHCAIPAGSTAGTCQLLADDGAPCDADVGCASGRCDAQTHSCAASTACL